MNLADIDIIEGNLETDAAKKGLRFLKRFRVSHTRGGRDIQHVSYAIFSTGF
jgi:hypothetical protein